MLSIELEQAIRQLEETTEELATTKAADWEALREALERRANAITRLALAAEAGASMNVSGSAVERLAGVLVRGEDTTRHILESRRDMSNELNRLNHVLQSLAAPDLVTDPMVECEG